MQRRTETNWRKAGIICEKVKTSTLQKTEARGTLSYFCTLIPDSRLHARFSAPPACDLQ